MKFFTFFLVSIFSNSIIFANDQDPDFLSVQQRIWAKRYAATTDVLESANSSKDLKKEFSTLSLCSRPHPELYSLYLRDDTQEGFQLAQDPMTSTIKLIRLYGVTTDGSVNYVTKSRAPIARETLAHTHKVTYKSKNPVKLSKLKTKRSNTYPSGCLAYNYVLKSGRTILLDRGHGVDRADTSDHPGRLSIVDPENLIPQNAFYDNNIRSRFVESLREKGLDYKEISIYHRDHSYCVQDHANQTVSYDVPLPEGFVFLVFNKNTETEVASVQEAYYFPNLIDYTTIVPDSLSAGSQCDYFCKLFKIKEKYFKEWFWNPSVEVGEVNDHIEQLNLAEKLTTKLLDLSHFYFEDFSEDQMPPKARSALLSTLLEWNAQSAATLEFVGLQQQLNLVNLYRISRNFYELDSRHSSEKIQAMKKFLKDSSVSDTARDIVDELFQEIKEEKLSFLQAQEILQNLIHYIQETMHDDPDYWDNAKPFSEAVEDQNFLRTFNTPYIIDLFCPDQKKVQVGSFSYNFRLSTLNPKTDLKKLVELVGGFDIRDMDKAEAVLNIVEARTDTIPTTIQDKLSFISFFSDVDKFPNSEKVEKWENSLANQTKEEGTSLLEKRYIADFYSFRNMHEQHVIWLEQIVEQLDLEPTTENFLAIADWCGKPTGAFLQNTNEATEHFVRSGSFTLGINIYAALIFNRCDESLDIYPNCIREYARKMAMIDKASHNWMGVIFPLEAFSTGDGIIMEMLKKIETSILRHFPRGVRYFTEEN